jgi:hypothetical protein
VDVTWTLGVLADFQAGLLTAEWDGETSSQVRINGATGQRTVPCSLVYSETAQFVTAAGVHNVDQHGCKCTPGMPDTTCPADTATW